MCVSPKVDFKNKLIATVIARHNLPVIEMAIASQVLLLL